MTVPPSITSHDDAGLERDEARAGRGSRSELFGVALTPLELDRTAILFAMLFLAAIVLVVGRSARDALLLTHLSVAWIAPVWMLYAIVSSIAAVAYARWESGVARDRLVVWFALASAATYVVLRVLLGLSISAAYVAFAVWSEVVANFAAVLVWALAQDLHDARSGKRLFGLIGAGRVLGVSLGGFLTGGIVKLIGTENLVLVLAAALVALALLARLLVRRHPLPRRARPAHERALERLPRAPLWRSGYVVGLAATTCLLFTALTVGDFQFKAIVRSAYPRADDLAGFLGTFYGAVGLVGVAVQVLVTPRLLSSFGVGVGLATMPAVFLGATLGLWAQPSLLLAALVKGADNGLQYTVHEATTQLLLFPFADRLRERVRALIGAAMKPLGYGVGAAVLLLVAPRVEPGPELVRAAAALAVWTVPMGALLLVLAPLVRRGYLRAMRQTLARREIVVTEGAAGPRARALLLEALEGVEGQEVLFAMTRLHDLEPRTLRSSLARLCEHPDAQVRGRAIKMLVDLAVPDAERLARVALADPDAEVRNTAVHALSELLQEDAHDELTVLADRHDDAPVRTAAIAALVRRCGLDGMLDGAPRLAAMLAGTAQDRREAAHVLELIGSPSLERALARLLVDSDATVRRAAVHAAANVRDVRIVGPLVAMLAERGLAPLAARALSELGAVAVPELHARLTDPATPRGARLWIPRVLFRIETYDALDALLACINESDDEVRQKVLASASRLRLALDAPPVDAGRVRRRIEIELAEHVAARDEYLAVRSAVLHPLCEEHVLARLRKGIVRMLRLCELAYPRQVVASVRAHLFGKDAGLRANALEVLESLLDRSLRVTISEVVARFLTLSERVASLPAQAPSEAAVVRWLAAEIEAPSPYRAALALEAAAAHRAAAALDLVVAALAHAHPLVREGAIRAAVAIAPDEAPALVRPLTADSDLVVSSCAARAISREPSERRGEAEGRAENLIGGVSAQPMYGTIEKVIFLQRVPVFAKVSGDDLVDLARNAPVIAMDRGDVVFRQGDAGGALYFVVSGAVSLSVDKREVALLGPGDVFGEMSIFDREPRATTATVTESAELLCVSAEDFQEAVRETVEIAEAVIVVLNKRLREADRRLAAARKPGASLTPATPIAPLPSDDGEPEP